MRAVRRAVRSGWWAEDLSVVMCELDGCGCPIQRTPGGTVDDGLRLHIATVHLGKRPSSVDEPAAAVTQ